MARELEVQPHVEDIEGYRSVWVLATVNKENRLKGTHYAVCLMMGRPPTWGIFNITGKLLRYAHGRLSIQDMYPNHVWRRVPARWQFRTLHDVPKDEREKYLIEKYKGNSR